MSYSESGSAPQGGTPVDKVIPRIEHEYGEDALNALDAFSGLPPREAVEDHDLYGGLTSYIPLAVLRSEDHDLEDLWDAEVYRRMGVADRLASYDDPAVAAVDATLMTLGRGPERDRSRELERERRQTITHPDLGEARFGGDELEETRGVLFDASAIIDLLEWEGPGRDGDLVGPHHQLRLMDTVQRLGRVTGRKHRLVIDDKPCDYTPNSPWGHAKQATLDILDQDVDATFREFEYGPSDLAQTAKEDGLALVAHGRKVREIADRKGVPAAGSDVAANAYEDLLRRVDER